MLMKKTKGIGLYNRLLGVAGLLGCLSASVVMAAPLTLDEAVKQALARDIWLDGSRFNEQAKQAMSDAAGRLPDPKVNLALANLPIDTFDFNQEPMTQLVVGMSQMIPRGDTLELSSRKLAQEGGQQPLLRADRQARVRLVVSQLWLDAWKAQHSMALIEQNRTLFEQLEEVATSSYVSALGRTRQQDLVRAQLELTQIDDRLILLQQQYAAFRQRLAEWLLQVAEDQDITQPMADIELAQALPQLALPDAVPVTRSASSADEQMLGRLFMRHPAVQVLARQIDIAHTDVELAQQQYQPQWGVNASYGYRGDDAMGRDRTDFISVGVSLDLPLFSTRKQDSGVEAVSARAEAIKTERLLKLRQMIAGFRTAQAQLVRLDKRLALYRERLLPQSKETVQAALNAYTTDTGDFAEVVRARITELNAQLAELDIAVEQQKQIAQLNYFLASSAPEGE